MYVLNINVRKTLLNDELDKILLEIKELDQITNHTETKKKEPNKNPKKRDNEKLLLNHKRIRIYI